MSKYALVERINDESLPSFVSFAQHFKSIRSDMKYVVIEAYNQDRISYGMYEWFTHVWRAWESE